MAGTELLVAFSNIFLSKEQTVQRSHSQLSSARLGLALNERLTAIPGAPTGPCRPGGPGGPCNKHIQRDKLGIVTSAGRLQANTDMRENPACQMTMYSAFPCFSIEDAPSFPSPFHLVQTIYLSKTQIFAPIMDNAGICQKLIFN